MELKNLISFTNNKITITSVNLCELINILRKEEKGENSTDLLHKSLMVSIKMEIEALNKLGISQQNILPSTYINSRGKEYPCYELNDEGMLEILNKESPYVRYKTTQLIRELKEEINKLKSLISEKEQCILDIYNGGQQGVISARRLTEIEVAEVREKEVKPLQGKVEELSPLAEMLIKRFEKGENIGWKDINDLYNFKRGACSKWAIDNGYIYKSKKDVRDKGKGYFQRYVINGFKNICITPDGIKLIDKHQDEIEKK